MSRATRLASAVALLLLFRTAGLAADITIPFLTGRVVDDANILSQGARDRLTAAMKAHEAATTNQIVVLTVPTIGGVSVEEYAVKVFESWKLGQKGKDNGVLVVVVPQDRKMRIEVGYGLEGTLTDGAAGEIIRTWMTPEFKAGDYDKGVEDGVAAVIAKLEGRALDDRRPAVAPPTTSGNQLPPMGVRIVGGLFIVVILGIFTTIGVAAPGFGWFLYFFLIPFWGLFPMAFIGVGPGKVLFFTYLIGFPIVKLALGRTDWYKKKATELKGPGGSWISMMTDSSGSSGSGWSSSSSSDGFSGGGGSSGGGGASGSW